MKLGKLDFVSCFTVDQKTLKPEYFCSIPEDTAKDLLITVSLGRYFLLFHMNCTQVDMNYLIHVISNKFKGDYLSMFELKLIWSIELPTKMNAGVFLACADDIELFDFRCAGPRRKPIYNFVLHLQESISLQTE